MKPDENEAAQLRAEWQRAQGWGHKRDRKRLVATVAAMAVALPIMASTGYAAFAMGLPWELWLAIPFFAGGLPGWYVRNRLWPKGQMA